MNVETILVGNFTNCYLVIKNNSCLIIDPGFESNKIISKITNLNYEVKAILITHNHPDHIGALKELKNYYKVESYDYHNLEEKEYNLFDFNFEVIYTPGHTNDSITFYFKEIKAMFVGDFIFLEDIGRCDLPTGDFSTMLKSINKIKLYDVKTTLYPGHEEKTTLEHEIKYNQYFQ